MILRIKLSKQEKKDFKKYCEEVGLTPKEMIEKTIKSYLQINKLMKEEKASFEFLAPKTIH